MPFDPTLPKAGTKMRSGEIRANFIALNDKIDAIPAGPQGPQGMNGNDGAPGPQGPQGMNGNDGAPGAQGPQGMNGNDGAPGPQGPQGMNGNDGSPGPQGPQGMNGNDGAPGPQGPQGMNGNDGAPGPQGPQGNDGAVALMAVTVPGTSPVGMGSVTFGFATPAVNLGWLPGTRIRAAAVADPANWMEGIIIGRTTGDVTLSVDLTAGAGSFTGWNLSIAGAQGAPGEVTNAALATALADTLNAAAANSSANTNAVPTLDTPFADPDTETLRQAFNALVLAQRR